MKNSFLEKNTRVLLLEEQHKYILKYCANVSFKERTILSNTKSGWTTFNIDHTPVFVFPNIL